ncbi:carbohydrate kinase [Synechococcales cyanobacterium C]|uniref:Carbohydrate kinase n=1 Tax=Petrachloros mirabilis ULC683 TaxID=2781853 RepID=A0A8K1ZX08_9CYAN|nr:carbohydrate kinase [Petrachloros mirabilis]NCJ06810.1 carbohydrate kinase [Petrachloros mirabilis ULC683]
MPDPQVLCLGEVLFDYLADQLGQALESVQSWTPYPGGAPANVACSLAKLGTPAAFVGCVGTDVAGDELVQLLQAEQVNIRGLQRHPHAPTRKVYVTRSVTGERSFAGFGGMKSHEFADAYLRAEQLPETLFQGADYLVLGTLEMAYDTSREAIERAFELARHYRVKVLVDVNWRPVFWSDEKLARRLIQHSLTQADYLKLSSEEAEWLWGITDPTQIQARFPHVQGVLVTAGDQGCWYWLQGHGGMVPAFTVPTIDTTGAGDAFVAGFLHQLCQNSALCHLADQAEAIMTYASAVGALTTLKAGAIAAQPTATEVAHFLAKAPR